MTRSPAQGNGLLLRGVIGSASGSFGMFAGKEIAEHDPGLEKWRRPHHCDAGVCAQPLVLD